MYFENLLCENHRWHYLLRLGVEIVRGFIPSRVGDVELRVA